MSQYIGKTISLISNKGLRYVGLLDNINADDATVALKSVRSFGTEGRIAAGGNPNAEVPPGTDVYDYVVFRGSDVKDLTVLDTPIDQVKPQKHTPSPSPAPGAYQGYQQSPQPTKAAAPSAGQVPAAPTQTTAPASKQTAPAQHETRTQPQDGPTPTQTQPQLQPQAAPAAARSEGTRNKENASPAQPAPQNGPLSGLTKRAPKGVDVPETAFDFESANAKFTRDDDQEKDDQPLYNKQSSFFDNISSSSNEKNSMRWAEEKNLNMDTFGESSVNHRGRGRGRGRGGWRGSRGGRGNWRGRGRGNKSNNDYNNNPEWA